MTADDQLAAEYAIGLLDGSELLAARGRLTTDPAFAGLVDQWQMRLVPLLDAIPPETPPAAIWQQIEAELAGPAQEGQVIALQRRVRFWQRTAAVTATAACAALATLVIAPQLRTDSEAPAPAPATRTDPILAASIPIADTPLRLAVTFIPERDELLVSASGLTADGVHDHELWLVPDQGALRSLGVVVPGRELRVALDPATAQLIHDGSGMVLTREPLGGKPPAAAAGPVVAEGTFTAI